GRRHVEFARIGLGIGDELGNGRHRNGGIDFDDLGHADNARDGRDIADEIEVELVVERRIDRIRRSDPKERVAVGWRMHDRLGGDIAARPRWPSVYKWWA